MNLLKKIVLVAFVFAVVGFSAPNAEASMLSNLKKEVEALKAQVARLSIGLTGAVQLASEKDYSSCVGKYYSIVTKEGTTYWCEGTVESEIENEAEDEKIEESKEEESKDEATTEDEKDLTGGTRWRIDSEGCSLYYDWNTGHWIKSDPACPKKDSAKITVPTITNNTTSATAQITLPLVRGSYGDQVIKLQEILKSLGYFTGDTGLAFGPKTEQAIKDFQKANGLGMDGKVGPNTRARLNEKARGLSLGGTGTTPPTSVCKPSTAPYIKVLSPNGGEFYTAGQQITVKWSTCNIPSTSMVNIHLVQHPNTLLHLETPLVGNPVNTTINDGVEIVTLPTSTTWTSLIYGNNFKVMVRDQNYTDASLYVSDLSDNNFSINGPSTSSTACNTSVAPYIKVLAPNGGESYTTGQQVTVKWVTCNLPYNVDSQLDIMDDRILDWTARSFFGTSPVLNYAQLVSSNGSAYTYQYTFIVPENFNSSLPAQYQGIFGGNHYKMKAIAVTQTGTQNQTIYSDMSDNLFALNNQVTSPSLCNSSSQPSLHMITPNGGETFAVNGSMTIKWSACNPATPPLNSPAKITLKLETLNESYTLQNPTTGAYYWFVSQGVATLPTPYVQAMQASYGGQNFKIRGEFTSGIVNGQNVSGSFQDSSDNKFTINGSSQSSCTLNLSTASNPVSQNVQVGTNNFLFAGFEVGADGCDARMNNVKINVEGTIAPNNISSSIKNLKIKVGNAYYGGTLSVIQGQNTISFGNYGPVLEDGDTSYVKVYANVIGGAGLNAKFNMSGFRVENEQDGEIINYIGPAQYGPVMNIVQ